MIAEPTPAAIRRAAELLRAGELVGLPTETVYGLGADALNLAAVKKIYAAKGRPADHPLIVHLPDASHMPCWASVVPEEAVALANAFWPGPLTLILKRGVGIPDEITGGQDTVGLRVPSHPVALDLLQAFGSGVAAPSANRFGRISPTTATHVEEELGDSVAMILDGGACAVGIESTIVDLSRGKAEILRPGAITTNDIDRVMGHPASSYRQEQKPIGAAPRVSGALAAHYAPRTPLRLVPASRLIQTAATLAGAGRRVAVLAHSIMDPRDTRLIWHAAPPEPDGYARVLYAALRALDASAADSILVETLPTSGVWHAISNRLERAAAGSGSDDQT